MNDQIKNQVIEQVQKANNVLVAVSSNPTVDELSASIGLTLLLNKLGKHATTVFSGVVPSTIEFLQPEKTIETTTDSLRDFIIALDKSKADKLRYKVEDDVVRIFITPYKTSITEDDLNYSQGDFNVDVVLALGVTKKADLDRAIIAHGRILHDATVITLSNRDGASELGSINWQSKESSSLCEMTADLALGVSAENIDGQMATAFMTGIIAETDRFRNDKTSPYVLSLGSKLMEAGANQKLIADKLEEPAPAPKSLHMSDGDKDNKDESKQSEDGELSVRHGGEAEADIDRIHIDEHGNLASQEEEKKEDVVEAVEEVAEKLAEETPEEEKKDGTYLGEPQNSSLNDQIAESGLLTEDSQPQKVEDHHPLSDNHTTLTHGKTIDPIPHPGDVPKSDKPFDINEAMQQVNGGGSPDPSPSAQPQNDDGQQDQSAQVPPQDDAKQQDDPAVPPLPVEPLPQEQQVEAVDANSTHPVDMPPPPAQETPQHPVVKPMPAGSSAAQPSQIPPQPQPIDTLPPAGAQEKPEPAESEVTAVNSEEVIPKDTLVDLEKAVNSPHVQGAGDDAVQSAQDAVNLAASSQPPQFPQKSESVGAQPVDLGPPKPLNSSGDPSSPPPVPPPMTPQFYDQDGQEQDVNPFLNPGQPS